MTSGGGFDFSFGGGQQKTTGFSLGNTSTPATKRIATAGSTPATSELGGGGGVAISTQPLSGITLGTPSATSSKPAAALETTFGTSSTTTTPQSTGFNFGTPSAGGTGGPTATQPTGRTGFTFGASSTGGGGPAPAIQASTGFSFGAAIKPTTTAATAVPPRPTSTQTLGSSFALPKLEENIMATSKNTSENPLTTCQVCNVGKLAVFCKECMHSFCQSCKDQHDEIEGFSKHDTLLLCLIHSQPVTYLCQKCLKGVCVQCMFKEHKSHGKSFDPFSNGIENLRRNRQEQQKVVVEIMSKLPVLQEHTQVQQNFISKARDALKIMKDKYVDKVTKIDNYVNNIEEDFEKPGDKILDDCMKISQAGNALTMSFKEELDEVQLLSGFAEVEKKVLELVHIFKRVHRNTFSFIGSSCAKEIMSLLKDGNFANPFSEEDDDWSNPKLLMSYQELKGQRLQQPRHLTILDDNSVLVTDFKGTEIYRVGLDGSVKCEVEQVKGVFAVEYSNNHIYLIEAKRILKVISDQNTQKPISGIDAIVLTPEIGVMYKLLVLSDETILVTKWKEGKICKFDPATNRSEEVISGLTYPSFITQIRKANGEICFAVTLQKEKEGNRVNVYRENWTLLSSIGSLGSRNGEVNTPEGTALTSSGHILVADKWNNRVSLFTLDGQFQRHVLTQEDGIKAPYALAYRRPYLWLTECDWRSHKEINTYARLKCFHFA